MSAVSAEDMDNLTLSDDNLENDEVALADEHQEVISVNTTESVEEDAEVTITPDYKNVVSGRYFCVHVTDEDKNPVTKKNVYFTLNGLTTKATTNSNGMAKLIVNETKGYYTIHYKFNETGYVPFESSCKILVLKSTQSKIKASDFVAYAGIINHYKVTLSVNGIALAKKVVSFKINGVTYDRKTDKKGEATLDIGLKKGKYSVEITYAGEKNIKGVTQKHKVTVKKGVPSKIKRANSVVFRHKTLNQFKIKLYDVNGDPIVHKKVFFKINNVKYAKMTNKKGIASLDVKLKKGSYKMTVKSMNNSVYKKVSKTYTIKVKPKQARNNGFWLLSADIDKVNFTKLESYGTKHLFLNAKAIENFGKKHVESFIKDAGKHDIKVHIWMQVFYKSGEWHYPVYKNGTINKDFINSKVNLAKEYAKLKGVGGVHFDYLRFPGNAYKYKNAVKAVNYFTKQASAAIHGVNSKLIVSAAVMPEPYSMKYYYAQDIPTMSKYLDVIVPMVYKGNYNAGTSWILKVTQLFIQKSNGAKIWTGLQTYGSDSNVKNLPASELMNDADAAAMGGAYGVIMFRFGLINYINFNDV